MCCAPIATSWSGAIRKLFSGELRSRPHIHLDTDEIPAIGDLAEIDHGPVGGGEHPADFRDRRIQRNLQEPCGLQVGGSDRERLPRAR